MIDKITVAHAVMPAISPINQNFMALNPEIISEDTIARIRDLYLQPSDGDSHDDHFQIVHSPFKALKFKDFYKDADFLRELTEEVEKLTFYDKQNDLYNLKQSEDLTDSENEVISKFVSTLRKDVGQSLSRIMEVSFNDNFTLTASRYAAKDVLLCHDDKCVDRCVAFVLYLTGTGEEKGGAFEMFGKDGNGQPTTVVKSLPAVANSFLCFEVGNFTYHQVSEVIDPTFERLSLNGWFHSDREISLLDYADPRPPVQQQVPNEDGLLFDECVSPMYMLPATVSQACAKFEGDSQIEFLNFLRPNMYKKCLEELKTLTDWTPRGPANRRHYSIIENVQEPNLKKLFESLASPQCVSFLKQVTGLSLVPKSPDVEESSEFLIELQKWAPGDYTMATDNDEYFLHNGLDFFLWFGSEEAELDHETGGNIVYLSTDEDDDDEDDRYLLGIDPQDNALHLVYRTDMTVRFTKYINHTAKLPYYCIAATYYERDED